jgi:hypothetical protein
VSYHDNLLSNNEMMADLRPDRGGGREMTRQDPDGLSLAELEAETGTALPDREALSVIPPDPSTALLDVFIDLDAALDLAAPINAALAANANLALPIDAAVSANVLSPGSVSLADANQTSIIEQVLQADATASSNQDSAIMQGEGGGTAVTDAGGQTGELESTPIAAAPTEPAAQIAPVPDTTDSTEPVEQLAPVPEGGTATSVAEPAVEPAPTVEPEAVPAASDDAAAAADAAAAEDGATGHGSGGVSEIARSAPGAMSQ